MCLHALSKPRFDPSVGLASIPGAAAVRPHTAVSINTGTGSVAESVLESNVEPSSGQRSTAASRRHRLWELSGTHHCPIVGVCFKSDEVRHLLRRENGVSALDDFELHVRAVHQCAERNDVSRMLARELDRRYALQVRRYATATDSDQVIEFWHDDLRDGRAASALWAALTHPLCSKPVGMIIYGDIHLLQHQSAAQARSNTRVAVNEREELERMRAQEHAVQAQFYELRRNRDEQIHKMAYEIQRLELENRVIVERLEHACSGEPSCQIKLKESLRNTRSENQELRAANEKFQGEQREARGKSDSQQRLITGLSHMLEVQCNESSISVNGSSELLSDTVTLAGRRVLCVGGRPSSISGYRELIERLGGKFAHHDGGIEQAVARLEPALIGADLVLCQASCVSHVAYWRVKKHCRRNGKHCLYMESTGLQSLIRSLATNFSEGVKQEDQPSPSEWVN